MKKIHHKCYDYVEGPGDDSVYCANKERLKVIKISKKGFFNGNGPKNHYFWHFYLKDCAISVTQYIIYNNLYLISASNIHFCICI